MQLKSTYSQIWSIAWPVILSSFAQSIIGITDSAFLGRVGEVEMGASAVAGIYYYVFVIAAMAIGTGIQILIARKAGEKKDNEIGIIFDHSLLIMVFLSAAIFITLYFFSQPVMKALISSAKVLEAAVLFLNYRSWGVFFSLIIIVFRSYYVGIADTRILVWNTIVMTLTNLLLNYALIFGNWGFPEMGIAGSGLASTIAEGIAALFFVIHIFFSEKKKIHHLFQFPKMDPAVMLSIFKLSLPLIGQNVLSIVTWFLFFITIEGLGEHALAISTLMRNDFMLLMNSGWGLAAAANTMTSNLIGQGKHEDVAAVVKKCTLLSVLCMAVVVQINVFFPEEILSLFTNDSVLIKDSYLSLYVLTAGMISFSAAIVFISALSGTGNTRAVLYIEIAAIICYIAYLYVLVFIVHSGLHIIWTGEFLYWALIALLAAWQLKRGKWKRLKI